MSINTTGSGLAAFATKPVNRRSFLGFIGVGAAVVALAGCSTGTSGIAAGIASAEDIAGVIPNYYPIDFAAPDLASVNGSTAGYLKLPTDLLKSVAKVPGSGGTYTDRKSVV